MGREESIGEIVLQLEKLDDESLEYLSHWSMPWGVLPLLHDFEDGKLMRDVDCDMHVALECKERDELICDMWRELVYATNAKVVRCKACGRVIVSMGARGIPRQFCDTACTKWASRNPGREHEHKRRNGDVEPDNFMWKLYERIVEEGVDV